MRITFYLRDFIGGISTYVNELICGLEKYDIEVNVIRQDPRSIPIVNEAYCIDRPESIRKVIREAESSDILHIHHPSTSLEMMIPFKNMKDVNIVNSFYVANKGNWQGFAEFSFAKVLGNLYKKKSKRYITINTRMKDQLSKYKETDLIMSGIDPNKFRPLETERYFDEITVGYHGRLFWNKNIFSLVKACQELDVPLVIGGQGMLYEKLKKFESDKIKVLGYIKDVPAFMNSFDIFASPSTADGSLVIAAMEAMACGRPVILSNCGGEEYRVKAPYGRICDPTPISIKESIKDVMNSDIKEMGNQARKEVLLNYTRDIVAEKTLMTYQKALES